MCSVSGTLSLLNSVLRRSSFNLPLLYFGTISFQTRFSFLKGRLKAKADLSVASSLQEISNVREFPTAASLGSSGVLRKIQVPSRRVFCVYFGDRGFLLCEMDLCTRRNRERAAESPEMS